MACVLEGGHGLVQVGLLASDQGDSRAFASEGQCDGQADAA
jgi:hypothetical protein